MNFYYLRFLAIILLFMLFFGCAGGEKELYYWGRYEDAIYEMYLTPGSISLTDEILRLEEQIEKAQTSGQSVPPGFHAHLAMLYSNNGNLTAAITHFQTEKEKFPESADFIDGILERMKK